MEYSTEKYYKLKLNKSEAKKLKHICQSYNPTDKDLTKFEKRSADLAESIEIFIHHD